jgi:hypothetical protein
MRPVLKRILVHGALTAGVLALIGMMFAELAGLWVLANTNRTGAGGPNGRLPPELRYRVPATLGVAGFLFVAAGELVMYRLRRNAPAAKAAPPADEVEKLLNDLLAKAEAKMAQEQGAGSPEQPTGHGIPSTGTAGGQQPAESGAAGEPAKPGAPTA